MFFPPVLSAVWTGHNVLRTPMAGRAANALIHWTNREMCLRDDRQDKSMCIWTVCIYTTCLVPADDAKTVPVVSRTENRTGTSKKKKKKTTQKTMFCILLHTYFHKVAIFIHPWIWIGCLACKEMCVLNSYADPLFLRLLSHWGMCSFTKGLLDISSLLFSVPQSTYIRSRARSRPKRTRVPSSPLSLLRRLLI